MNAVSAHGIGKRFLPEAVKRPLRPLVRAYEHLPDKRQRAGIFNLVANFPQIDQPPFEVMQDAIFPGDAARMHALLINEAPPPKHGQSGAHLDGLYHFARYLTALERRISARYRCRMYLRLDRSSYRLQPPDGIGALALHQDYDALREPRQGPLRGPHMSEPDREPCCTVWIPLTDIDEETPTLQVCTRVPDRYITHKADDNHYAVLRYDGGYRDWPMITFTQLPAGAGIVFGPLTLHRTCVRPWHTKTRRSLDLRFSAFPPFGQTK